MTQLAIVGDLHPIETNVPLWIRALEFMPGLCIPATALPCVMLPLSAGMFLVLLFGIVVLGFGIPSSSITNVFH